MSIDAQSIDLKDRFADFFYKNLDTLKDGLPAHVND